MPTMANNDVHCADTENGQTDMHFNFLTFAMLLSRVYLPAKMLMAVVKHARIRREAGGPDLLKNHKSIWFPSNTGPDPLKIIKLPNQILCWAVIGMPAKRHSDR